MEGYALLHGSLPLLLLVWLLLPIFIPLSSASAIEGALSRDTKELSRGADDEDQALRTTRVSRVTSSETSHSASSPTGFWNRDNLARGLSVRTRQKNDTKSLVGNGHLRHHRRRAKRKRKSRTKKTNDDFGSVSSAWKSSRKDLPTASGRPSGLATKRFGRRKHMRLKSSSERSQLRGTSDLQRNHERAALLHAKTKEIFSGNSLRKPATNSLKPSRILVDLLIDRKSSEAKGTSSTKKVDDMGLTRSTSESGENKESPIRTNTKGYLRALSRRMVKTTRKNQFVIPIISGRTFSKLQFNPNIEVNIEVLRDDDITSSTSVDGAEVATTEIIHPTPRPRPPPPPTHQSTSSPFFDYYYYEDYDMDNDWLASVYSDEDSSKVLAPSGSIDFDSGLDFTLDTTFVGPDFVIPENKRVTTSAPRLTGEDRVGPTSDSSHDSYENGGTFLVTSRHNFFSGVTRPYNLWDDVASEDYDCEEESHGREIGGSRDSFGKVSWEDVKNDIGFGGFRSKDDYDVDMTSLVHVTKGGESEDGKEKPEEENEDKQERNFKEKADEDGAPALNIDLGKDLPPTTNTKSDWDVNSSGADKHPLPDGMNSSTIVDPETGNQIDPVLMSPRDLIRKLALVLDRLQESEEWDQVFPDGDACQVWTTCRAESTLQQLSFLPLLPSCPCLYPADIVYIDTIWDPNHNKTFRWRTVNSHRERIDIFRAGAHKCIRSQVQAITVSLAVQTCCYDRHQQLITRGSGAGTPSLVSPEFSPRLHYRVDVLPWLACNGNFVRYNAVRPPNNEQHCPTHPDDEMYNTQLLLATDY